MRKYHTDYMGKNLLELELEQDINKSADSTYTNDQLGRQ